MKVLSLFDGMSCGQIALKLLGITPEVYYASEIDKPAIRQTQLNFPDTIQLGDVIFLRKAMCWRADTVRKFDRSPWISEKTKQRFHRLRDIRWNEIDLILAGSPCQGFSFAGKQLAFDDPRSRLFFEFVHVLNHIRSLKPDVMFLLENVNMKRSYMRIISDFCGLFPVNINSNLVSAQNRDRWYWTNIRTRRQGLFGEVHTHIPPPKDRKIFLRDVLEENVDEKYYVSQAVIDRMNKPHKCFVPKIDPSKTGCLTTKNNSGQMSFDSGTTFISIEGKAPTQRTGGRSSLDKKHNYQFIKVNMEGIKSRNQIKSSCLTGAGGHGAGNHSDMDLILQRPRGYNQGALFEGKAPTLSSCAWEQNNLLCTKEVIQLNPSKDSGGIQPYQQDRIYDVNGISPALLADMSSGTHAIAADRIRRLTPTECARLQTVPAWYRWDCSDTQIYRMLGNGWTIEAIVHLLSYINERITQKTA